MCLSRFMKKLRSFRKKKPWVESACADSPVFLRWSHGWLNSFRERNPRLSACADSPDFLVLGVADVPVPASFRRSLRLCPRTSVPSLSLRAICLDLLPPAPLPSTSNEHTMSTSWRKMERGWKQFWPPPHPIFAKEKVPPRYAIQWRSVWHKSPLRSRDFYRKYGMWAQNMAYEPHHFMPCEPFYWGEGGLQFVDRERTSTYHHRPRARWSSGTWIWISTMALCSSGGCYSPQNPKELKYSKSRVLDPPRK